MPDPWGAWNVDSPALGEPPGEICSASFLGVLGVCYTLGSRSAVLHPTMRTTCLKGWKSEGLAYKRRSLRLPCAVFRVLLMRSSKRKKKIHPFTVDYQS